MFRALLSNRKFLLALIVGVVIFGALVVIAPIAQKPYSPPVPAGKEIEVLRIAQIAGGATGWVEDFYPFHLQDFTAGMTTPHYLESLVNLDGDLRPYGILAERWINPEPTVWRFFLVKNATFSSGSKFDADDVVFTINTLKSADYVAAEKMYTASISEVRKVDQFTVDLVTEEPDPILLSKLRYVWMLSNEDFDSTDTTHPPIGTGPYLITDAKKDEFVELTRRDDYWAELPKPKKVIYKVFADDPDTEADESTPAIIQALLDGEIDIADYMPLERRGEFDANPNFRTAVKGDVYLWFVCLDMNRDKSPYVFDKKTGKQLAKNPLADKRVRQALYYAINVEELIQNTYGGLAERQDQLVPKEAFGYDPSYTRPSYDPEKAKALLAEAGYPDGFAINLDAYHPYITGNYLPEVVRQWKKIGIEATAVTRRENPDIPGSAEDRARFEKGDTSAYFNSTASDLGDALPVFTSIVHTMKGEYGSETLLYSNSEVDRLIEQAETTANQDERLELMQRIQRMVLDDFAYIPLNTDGILYFVRDSLIWEPRIDSFIYGFDIAGK